MLTAALLAFLVFDRSVAAAALLFLSLGDPAAALAGARMPGPRLLGKSPGGTAAFTAVALGAGALLVWAGVFPSWSWGLAAGAVAAGVGGVGPVAVGRQFHCAAGGRGGHVGVGGMTHRGCCLNCDLFDCWD